MREQLVREGVNVRWLKALSAVRTPHCAVLVDQWGERLAVGESDHADVAAGALSQDILDLTDFAIFSAPALERFVEGTEIEQRLQRAGWTGLHYVGVTVGAGGYYWMQRNQIVKHQPSFDVLTTDTTGAGDAFHGAFSWAITHGFDEAECARIASAVAAMSCRGLGARSALPGLLDLEAFLREHDRVRLDGNALGV